MTWMTAIGELRTALEDLLFPAFCLGCGSRLPGHRVPLLCRACEETLVLAGHPHCLRCGLPLPAGEDHLCGACLKGMHAFDRARFAVLYQPPADRLVHALKFNGELATLATMAWLIHQTGVMDELGRPDLVVPVPLHAKRLRQRGFNQSLLLAKAVFEHADIPVDPFVLERCRETPPQSSLTARERRRNLRRAFRVASGRSLAGKRVLLIDDVWTTGATLNECAKALKKSECVAVEAFSLARRP